MSNLVQFAEEELKITGLNDEDSDYNGQLGNAVLEIVKVFAKQGHSGLSAAITTEIVEKLMRFEPLTALTGADDEWNEISESFNGKKMWQNRRCGRVFKEADGRAYDIEGKVFVEKNGEAYTNGNSRTYITFPYTPKTKRIKVKFGVFGRLRRRVTA